MNRPPMVPTAKATTPRIMMPAVWPVTNFSAASFEPTAMPSMIVTMLQRAFCIVSERRSTTPLSFAMLPNMSAPMSGTAEGSRRPQRMTTTSGKTTFSIFLTGRSCFMWILRSASVVHSFMSGGWMTGTRAM